MRTETSSETYLPAHLQWNVDEPESGAARATMDPVFQSWLRGFGIRVKRNAQTKGENKNGTKSQNVFERPPDANVLCDRPAQKKCPRHPSIHPSTRAGDAHVLAG